MSTDEGGAGGSEGLAQREAAVLALAVEASGAATWDWDVATGDVQFSDAWHELLGFAPGTLTPRVEAWERLLHPEDAPRVRAALDAYLAGRAPAYDVEYRLRARDGSWRWHLARGRVFARDATGRATRMVGINMDVDARHAAEQALREREATLHLLVEGLRDHALYLLTPEGHIASWNAGAERLTGFRAEEVMGQHISARYVPEDVQAGVPERELERARAEGRSQLEGWRLRKDGSRYWADVSISALRDAQGRLTGFVKLTRDLTERRQAELALRRSEARLASVVGSAMDAIVSVDDSQCVVLFNAAAERMFGVKAADALGSRLERFLPERFRAHHAEHVRRFAAEGVTSRSMGRQLPLGALRADGTEFPVEASISHVAQVGGGHLFTVILRDVGERQALEAQLRQAQKMEAVGQLAGGIAHDFNNLLSVILSMTSLVLSELPRGGPLHEDLSEVQQAAERAAALTRQLLVFSRSQAMQPRLLDLNQVVREAERLLRRTLPEDVLLLLDVAPRPLPVRADPGQLEQVLMNLVVNARDAMPRGGTLTLETGVEEHSARDAAAAGLPGPGTWVHVSVRDTGTGIDPGVQARLFEPFFTTKPPGQGTGLGLATVYGITQRAGGRVRVQSTPGEGSTFSVLLPGAAALPEDAAAAQAPALPRGTETLLLVEDEQAVRTATRRVLERHGYRVLEARHGADALRLWRERSAAVALVLADVRMPELGGRELADRLAAEAPALPVLLLSGYTDTAPALSNTPPVRAFLTKPLAVDALVREVRRLLDLTAAARPAGG